MRAWLVGHLVTDMEALGTFDGNTLAKVPGIVNSLTDDQVALLVQLYYLTRIKTEQDAYLYSLQQQGYSDEQVNEAKAEIADLLTAMHDQIVACYDNFVQMPEPVQYLANICYASVPGWCCRPRCFVPAWYYADNCFVGPVFDAACSGIWAGPVCNAYFDHGSRFYTRYHNVAKTVHVNHSTRLAHRQADWFRHQGDWRSVVAHDRFLHRSPTAGYRNPPSRIATGTSRHLGAPGIAYDRRPASALAGSKQNRPEVARHQDFRSRASRVPAARPPKAQHQAARHVSTGQPRAHGNAAKTHPSRASAPHPHAAHSPHPQHASRARPKPQHAAQAQSKSDRKRHG